MSKLKIVYGYPYFRSEAYPDVEQWELEYVRRIREAGFEVEGFCLTLNPPGPRLTFRELDRRWRYGDKELLQLYARLEERLEHADVLINRAGINLHPEFVERLPVFTVFQCFDDPESSHDLSRPVAGAYDLCLVGNVAEVDTYRIWGVKNAEWTTMSLLPGLYDPQLTEEQILSGERDIDLFMMIDRLSPWRTERLDRLAAAFPNAHFYGKGWPRGILPHQEQLAYLRRAKVGPNLHNSTGPINLRTFYLPANGVLQICDNKSHLGKLFDVGREVAGFDTVDECIDLCRYYLAHDKERREMAAAGWRRALTDYTETAVFARKVSIIEEYMSRAGRRPSRAGVAAAQQRRVYAHRVKSAVRTIMTDPVLAARKAASRTRNVARRLR